MASDVDEQARQRKAMTELAVTVLVGRAGGSVTFTATEYEEIVARYGGHSRVSMSLERIEGPGDKVSFRATLVRKDPGQGDLPM